MDTLGAAAKSWSGLFVFGADLKTTPAAVVASGVERSMRARVTAPDAPMGTSRTSTGNRVIDFFLVSKDIAEELAEINTVELSGLAPHCLVRATF